MSRIRANTITNQNANGAPNFPDGITVTGVVTATTTNQNITGDLTVSGNLGVGGTITYEDVKSVDSVGIITARAGIKDSTLTSGRVTYSGSGGRLVDNANLTFDGTTLSIPNGNLSVEQDSSSMVTPLTVSNGTSGGSADTRLLMKSYANGGGDPYIKFDAGGTNFLVGERYAGTTNNILVMGAGETAQSINGIFVRHDGKVGINQNSPTEKLEVAGNIKAVGGSAALLTNESGGGQGHIMSGGTSVYFGTTNNVEMRFRTNNTIRATIDTSGHFKPYANNSFNLGSSSLRWANIYTHDLNLSNEGGSNDVDGTWGDYTIQEGENDLFLINKRNGKKYKFNLTEVS